MQRRTASASRFIATPISEDDEYAAAVRVAQFVARDARALAGSVIAGFIADHMGWRAS